uniref:N-acetylglucosamine kinase n=1 Tax=Sphingobacterium sp. (strain 21) TaxID=743722 RepID=F4C9D7_SPHS2
MIAVVYSGSRFADWRLADKGKVVAGFKTMGINPYHNDERYISQVLNKNNSLINYAEKIKKIYFFGAGASSDERKETVYNAFREFFRYSKVLVEHDMLAAALATGGNEQALVGILGSGSNAAYYDGKRIYETNYGLGYILADEGSANWMGRYLLRNYLSETLPIDLENKFTSYYPLDRKQIMDKVYRNPNAALFLSSFADFVAEQKSHEFVHNMVMEGFNLLFETYFVPLKERYHYPKINFTGSVAAGYEPWLRQVANNHGMEVGVVIKEPIQNLLNYYLNKN